MNKDLLKVSIRQNAIYLPLIEEEKKQEELTSTTIALVAQLRKVGYSLSEELLHAINQLYPAQQMMILQVMKEALGGMYLPEKRAWIIWLHGSLTCLIARKALNYLADT